MYYRIIGCVLAIIPLFVYCQCECRDNKTEIRKIIIHDLYDCEDDYQGMDILFMTLSEAVPANSDEKEFEIRIHIVEETGEPAKRIFQNQQDVYLQECDIAKLKLFLDSCMSLEPVSDKVLYCDFNETDGVRCCLGILAFKTAECSYVDLQISPQKLKSILEKAEKMIAEERRKNGKQER